jgi:hypothetical protein
MSGRDPHKDAGVPRPRPGEGTFPKPSRDDAVAAGSTEEMTPGASSSADTERYGTGRRNPEASGKGESHPPHVPEGDRDAPVQDELESPDDVPVLPANASGQDQVSTEEQPTEIREESAYDQRPEEDKHWSPDGR